MKQSDDRTYLDRTIYSLAVAFMYLFNQVSLSYSPLRTTIDDRGSVGVEVIHAYRAYAELHGARERTDTQRFVC